MWPVKDNTAAPAISGGFLSITLKAQYDLIFVKSAITSYP